MSNTDTQFQAAGHYRESGLCCSLFSDVWVANGEKKTSMDTLTAIMSTAEAVNVAHAVGVRAWFLANRAGEPADLVECIAGTIVKDNEEDRARLRRYFEQRVATHKEAHWQAYYQARHRLP